MSTNNTGTVAQNSVISLSALDISLAKGSNKTIKSIELFQNQNPLTEVQPEKLPRAGQKHQETFNSPITLTSSDYIRVRVSVRWGLFPCQRADVNIDLRDEPYQKEMRKISVSAQFQRGSTSLVVPAAQIVPAPQTVLTPPAAARQQLKMPELFSSEVIQTIQNCPRFRLLVIGNTGVGKSTLIHNVFGVQDVKSSENARGQADIDREFISPTNDRFVVHDSLGFEAGDENHMQIMRDFVTRRQSKPEIKDQLHAIWLCLEIPYAGGRLLEAGVEMLLQHRREVLGDIPLVVVLTKVDLLDGYLEINLSRNETLEDCRSRFLEEHCIKPLRKAAGSNVTYIAVSKEEDYTDSLLDLLKTTMRNMANGSKGPFALVAIAQRISIQRKIDLSIEMGKKKYWNTLVKSAAFGGHTLRECLRVIQEEIVAIWNLNDPDECLVHDKFIDALLRTDNLGNNASSAPVNSSADGHGSTLQGLRDFLKSSDLALAIPRFMTSLALAAPLKLLDTYTGAQEDVKILMAYIVDINCIMQFIFLFTSGDRVTHETVAYALQAYMEPRKSVHASVEDTNVARSVQPGGRDYALEKIEELIQYHSIKDHEIKELKQRITQAVPPNPM